MHNPGNNAPDFEVAAARYFDGWIVRMFRREEGAPLPALDDLEPLEGKAIAQPGDNDPVARFRNPSASRLFSCCCVARATLKRCPSDVE